MLLFTKKWLAEKIFKTSFSVKKVILIFVAGCFFPFKRDLAPRSGFLPFSRKIRLVSNKLRNNKIFGTSFVKKKKIALILGARRLFSLKVVKCAPKQLFPVFSENCRIKRFNTRSFRSREIYARI